MLGMGGNIFMTIMERVLNRGYGDWESICHLPLISSNEGHGFRVVEMFRQPV